MLKGSVYLTGEEFVGAESIPSDNLNRWDVRNPLTEINAGSFSLL